MIGRQRELNEMAGALERALTGIGTVVVVSGEAGIGKTRLAREFSRIAAGQDARVLWANCRAGGEPRADYWPWRQVFRAIARDSANDAYGNSSPQLESRAGENRLPSNPASADTVQHQSRFDRFDAVGDKLEDLSREQPLVLIFDDLHAADEPSLALLGHVLWRIADCPIVAVITYRPLALPGARGLARLLSETPVRNALTIRLAPLSISEAAEMVRGTEQGSVLTAAPLVRIAGGNPRFLELLAGKGSSAQSDGFLDADFHAAAEEHLTVSPPARELMETAAVVGERFDLPVLLAVSGLDPAEFLDRLSETQTAGLVRESMDDPGNYYFVYPLVRSALYDRVVGARRAVLHRRAGKALEEVARGDEASVAAIAEHFSRGLTLGDSSKALDIASVRPKTLRHDTISSRPCVSTAARSRRPTPSAASIGSGGRDCCSDSPRRSMRSARLSRRGEVSSRPRNCARAAIATIFMPKLCWDGPDGPQLRALPISG